MKPIFNLKSKVLLVNNNSASKLFVLKRNKKQKGVSFVIVLLLSTSFFLIATTVMYISVVNTKNTRRNVENTRGEIASDSGLKMSLEKVKRFMKSAGLTQFQPNVKFGYTQNQMDIIKANYSSLSAESESSLDGSMQSIVGVYPDSSGTLPADKRMSGETYNKLKNYYSFTTQQDGKNVVVRYRIIDEASWSQFKTDASKKITVYSISSNDNGQNWKGLKSDITVTRANMSSYGVFFNDDLEILPGATMSFKGKIHTNKNMYLGGPLTLGTTTTGAEVSSAGHIFVGRKNDNSQQTDSVNVYYTANNSTIQNAAITADTDSINKNIVNAFNSNDLEKTNLGDGIGTDDTWKVATSSDDSSKWSTSTVNSKKWDWKSGASERWNNAVQDSTHGVEKKDPPKIDDIQPGGAYEQKAGMVIKTDRTTTGTGQIVETIQVKDSIGVVKYSKTLTYASATATIPTVSVTNNLGITADSSANPPVKADPFDSIKFKDGREQKAVTTAAIDIASLQKSPSWPANGLVYASRNDAVASTNNSLRNPSGFIIQNGSTLSKEMNFVTNNPVYVRGDFNKHKLADNTSIEDTDSRAGTASDTWKPASIISDATTMLSNSWDPNNANYLPSGTGTSPTAASNTEFNFTMITGNVKTKRDNTDTYYSGGLENFPRFLENWGSKTAKFRGSLIQLWESKYANTKWGGSYYSAPNRNWGFDQSYDRTNLTNTFADMFPSVTKSISVKNWRYLEPNDPVFNKNDILSMVN